MRRKSGLSRRVVVVVDVDTDSTDATCLRLSRLGDVSTLVLVVALLSPPSLIGKSRTRRRSTAPFSLASRSANTGDSGASESTPWTYRSTVKTTGIISNARPIFIPHDKRRAPAFILVGDLRPAASSPVSNVNSFERRTRAGSFPPVSTTGGRFCCLHT